MEEEATSAGRPRKRETIMHTTNPQAKSIFGQALALDAAEARAAYLEKACGGDAALRAEVESLLAALEGAGDFLKQPAAPGGTADSGPVSDAGEPATTPAADAAVGSRIGPYRLLQLLGEGGMGSVWVAEQTEPIKRRVALKLIKPGMDSAQVLRRFEQERQALALMDHTHIAKVLDAGTTEAGRPYFVMELVKGVPITKYCDRLQLPIRDRLALFLPVCAAIQHAHQKGIIHRDLKPSNVLVCIQDGNPVAKVIDFGVAKALHSKLAGPSLYTEIGQVVGTLEYMAPEQAELSALDIDTRADVYALGVLLYELLTGTTPLDRKRLKGAAVLELLRIIREEEPPRPSTRLTDSKESLPSVAAQRRTEPGRLAKEVRGELDWIVMRALEKDRTRRYDSASNLARDVERFLHDEPVEAGPPGTAYRLKKLLRRHRGPVAAVTAVFLALLAGVLVSTWLAVRAVRAEAEERRQRDTAEAEKRTAEAVRAFLLNDLLQQADAAAQADRLRELGGSGFVVRENPTIKELLDRASAGLAPERIEQKFPGQPLIQAEILETVGNAYEGIGEYARAIAHLKRAADLCRTHLGSDHPDTVSVLHELARTYLRAGKTAEAIALYEKVRDARTANLGPDHPHTLATLNNLAEAYGGAGKTTEAITLLEKVRDAWIAKFGPDHPSTLATLNNLAVAYQDAGKTAEAVALLEKVRNARISQLGPDHPSTLATLSNLASFYQEARKTAEAIALLEKVRDAEEKKLGPDHPGTLLTLNNLAVAYGHAGRTAEAIALLEKVRDAEMSKLGPDHPNTLATLHALATAYQDAGRMAEAIALYEKVRDARTARLGPDHPDTLLTLNNLAAAYWKAEKLDRSVPLFEELLQRSIKVRGVDHPVTMMVAINLAVNYCDAGRLPEAARVIDEWLPRAQARLGAGHRITEFATCTAARIRAEAGDVALAIEVGAEVLKKLQKQLPSDAVFQAGELSGLGSALLRAGKPADAIPLLEKARDVDIARLGPNHPDTPTILHTLAEAYRGAGRTAEAITLNEKLRDARVAKLGPDHPHTLSTLNNLALAYSDAGKLDQAVPLLEELLAKSIKVRGADDPDTVNAAINLAAEYRCAHRLPEAAKVIDEWLPRARSRLGTGHPQTQSAMDVAALIWAESGNAARGAEVAAELLAVRRKQLPADDPRLADTLGRLGWALLRAGKPADAEPHLRECLALREKNVPDDWKTFFTRSLLGGSLLGQKKYADAQPLLLAGYEGMRQREAQIKPTDRVRLVESLERLVQLYEATGDNKKADEWRKKVAEAKAPAKRSEKK
jgi:serine/threonine protein kinase/tetratricopeptide (TPR) repeat protein